MVLKNYDGVAFIDESKVVSASISKWGDETYPYEVNIATLSMNVNIRVETIEKANSIVEEIKNKVEEYQESQNILEKETYVDGFKDGVEYALKIKKEN